MTDHHAEQGPLNGAAAEAAESVERELRAARELLGMDISWVAEFSEGRKIFRTVEGGGSSFGFSEGDSVPLGETFCQRVVLGHIESAIPDAQENDELRHLPITERAGIRAYIGVPIELKDGTVYGTLCVASHRPNHDLSDRDVEFLRGISRRVATDIEGRRLSGS